MTVAGGAHDLCAPLAIFSDAGTLIGTSAIDPDPGDTVSTCRMMFSNTDNILVQKDNLGCFIKTDCGSDAL